MKEDLLLGRRQERHPRPDRQSCLGVLHQQIRTVRRVSLHTCLSWNLNEDYCEKKCALVVVEISMTSSAIDMAGSVDCWRHGEGGSCDGVML